MKTNTMSKSTIALIGMLGGALMIAAIALALHFATPAKAQNTFQQPTFGSSDPADTAPTSADPADPADSAPVADPDPAAATVPDPTTNPPAADPNAPVVPYVEPPATDPAQVFADNVATAIESATTTTGNLNNLATNAQESSEFDQVIPLAKLQAANLAALIGDTNANATMKSNLSSAAANLGSALIAADNKYLALLRAENGFVNLKYRVTDMAVWTETIPILDTALRNYLNINDAADNLQWDRYRVAPLGYGSQDNHYPAWAFLHQVYANRPVDQNTKWDIGTQSGEGKLTGTLYGPFYDEHAKSGKAPSSKNTKFEELPEISYPWPALMHVKPKFEPLSFNWLITRDIYTQGDGWKTYRSFAQNPYSSSDKGDNPIADDPYRRLLSDSAMKNNKARVGLFLSGPVGQTATVQIFDKKGQLLNQSYVPLSPLQYLGGGSTRLTANSLDDVIYINHANVAQWGAEAWIDKDLGKSQPGSHFNQVVVIEPDFDGFINVLVEDLQPDSECHFWYGDVILP